MIDTQLTLSIFLALVLWEMLKTLIAFYMRNQTLKDISSLYDQVKPKEENDA